MSKKDYSELSKEQLIELVEKLESKKKYGLVWDEERVPEQVVLDCRENLPVLTEVKEREIHTSDDEPTHILIEGDNFHALSVLNYTHQGKIDLIYIDPPYNTGAKDWKYNNDFVDENDQWRHSKWISMMKHRLDLAKPLLTDTGILVCAIDEYEVHNIRHLLDEAFGEENKLGIVTVLHNPKGRNLSKFFSANSEFMLVYAKDFDEATFNEVAIDEEVLATFNLEDEESKYRLEPFMRVRNTWSRENKPNNYYPIFVSQDLKHLTIEPLLGYYEVYPKTADGREWAWKNIPESFMKLNKDGYFSAVNENNQIVILHKYREKQVFKNVWTNKKYQSEFNGTNLLKKILGGSYFDYPKSLYLLIDILKITTKKDSIILDYFAGSGTTGQAVLELNKDGGTRQFILCTNNENNICEQVTYKRIKNIINGYTTPKGENIIGLSGNLKYLKTSLIKSGENKDQLRIDITKRCTEMLCLKEGVYKLKKETADWKIFEENNKFLAVYYDFPNASLDELRDEMNVLDGEKVLYCFTVDPNGLDKEDFSDWENIRLEPIPQKILDVYKQIFQ